MMSSFSLFDTSNKKKLLAFIIALALFTNVGSPNILYIVQYAQCVLNALVLKKRIKYASNTAIFKSRVRIFDLDWWSHMNNSKYLRHAELARVDFFLRSRIWRQLSRKGYSLGFVATNVRYRRELRLFQSFEIHTRCLLWDELQLIIEQRFIGRDNFLHSIVYGKYVLLKNGKKVTRSISNHLEGDGFHCIQFYEKPLIQQHSSSVPSRAHHGVLPTQQHNETNYNSGNNDGGETGGVMHTVSSLESMSSQNGFIEHKNGGVEPEMVAQIERREEKSDNDDIEDIATFVRSREQDLSRDYLNVYECRNEIPRSLRIWCQCLEQSSYESRSNLLG